MPPQDGLRLNYAFARAAVVVNEYGEVSIDHVLVEAPGYRMRVVDSGCLCGHVHDEIASVCSTFRPSAAAALSAISIAC